MARQASYSGLELTVKQVAKLLNISQQRIYSLVRQGKIPHYRRGRAIRFDPEELYRWHVKFHPKKQPK